MQAWAVSTYCLWCMCVLLAKHGLIHAAQKRKTKDFLKIQIFTVHSCQQTKQMWAHTHTHTCTAQFLRETNVYKQHSTSKTRETLIHPNDVMWMCLPGGVCLSVMCSCACMFLIHRHVCFLLIRDRLKETRTFALIFEILIPHWGCGASLVVWQRARKSSFWHDGKQKLLEETKKVKKEDIKQMWQTETDRNFGGRGRRKQREEGQKPPDSSFQKEKLKINKTESLKGSSESSCKYGP